jgi:RES domain-containing protein
MRFYRIADSRYAPESGDGARLYGGRWNSPGYAVIYACTSYAGAMLEKLVHTSGRMPRHQVCVTFEAPDSLAVERIDPKSHPHWNAEDCSASRRLGDQWLRKQRTAALLVPSVVFRVDHNVLINPAHADSIQIAVLNIEPVRWDARLFAAPGKTQPDQTAG